MFPTSKLYVLRKNHALTKAPFKLRASGEKDVIPGNHVLKGQQGMEGRPVLAVQKRLPCTWCSVTPGKPGSCSALWQNSFSPFLFLSTTSYASSHSWNPVELPSHPRKLPWYPDWADFLLFVSGTLTCGFYYQNMSSGPSPTMCLMRCSSQDSQQYSQE